MKCPRRQVVLPDSHRKPPSCVGPRDRVTVANHSESFVSRVDVLARSSVAIAVAGLEYADEIVCARIVFSLRALNHRMPIEPRYRVDTHSSEAMAASDAM